MLTEICQYLRNWFERAKHFGQFTITGGELDLVYDGGNAFSSVNLVPGQYYRIVGSALNDGVHQYRYDSLADETFSGAIWEMCVPQAVIQLADDIDAWNAKYSGVDSALNSPVSSESFGGYSYTKASGTANEGSVGWESVYFNRLAPWRKI